MAVFLLQFFMKFADRLIGKGLSLWIILKLVTYNLAWMLVLVAPMAVLISTLMAFGSMAQNNEIAVLKAAGVSLYRLILAPLIASILLAFLLIQFNNHVYPNANHAARLLGQDISRKKPTLSLVPGVFSQEVSKYSILVRNIDEKKNLLERLTIYDKSDPQTLNVITAQTGKLYFSKNQEKLVMDLWEGEIHTSENSNDKQYRKLKFEKHKIVMNADQFSFRETEPGSKRRGDRELSASQMIEIVDSLNTLRARYHEELTRKINLNVFVDTLSYSSNDKVSYANLQHVYRRVEDRLRNTNSTINSSVRRLTYNKKSINKYWVEIHKKYSLPVACIVFILLGAPLGTMTRRGGFGVAAGVSLVFFLIYWAFLIGGEKLADRGLLSPFWGMWSANFVLTALGIYLLIKSARERVTIEFTFLQKLVPKQLRTKKEDDQNS